MSLAMVVEHNQEYNMNNDMDNVSYQHHSAMKYNCGQNRQMNDHRVQCPGCNKCMTQSFNGFRRQSPEFSQTTNANGSVSHPNGHRQLKSSVSVDSAHPVDSYGSRCRTHARRSSCGLVNRCVNEAPSRAGQVENRRHSCHNVAHNANDVRSITRQNGWFPNRESCERTHNLPQQQNGYTGGPNNSHTEVQTPARRRLQLSHSYDTTFSQFRSGLVLYPLVDVDETGLDNVDNVDNVVPNDNHVNQNRNIEHVTVRVFQTVPPFMPKPYSSAYNLQKSSPPPSSEDSGYSTPQPSRKHFTSPSQRKSANLNEQKHRHTQNSANPMQLQKSKSETNLFVTSISDDEDEDDYGFLTPVGTSYISTATQKQKSPSTTHKILPKRWRSKSKQVPQSSSILWRPEGSCNWCSVSGRRVSLKNVNILTLSEPERQALQKIAVTKLQGLNMGCPIVIPKECTQVKQKKRVLKMIKKKSQSANLNTLLDKLDERNKAKESSDCQPTGFVFGIPLSKCISNDLEMKRRRSSAGPEKVVTPHLSPRQRETRKSSSSSAGSIENNVQNSTTISGSPASDIERHQSFDSLSESETSSHNTSSSLLDALSLSLSMNRKASVADTLLSMTEPKVPHILSTCFRHIEKYGLNVVGVFRVGSSKKRVKQLRDEFDSGKDVWLNGEQGAHDVAALIKEFFRDLPEPLLTRDLYTPLVATRKLDSVRKQSAAMKLLVSILPECSRDTLHSLLTFLNKVNQHSTDVIDENGRLLAGNKMDSHNLAMVFGPNILHKCKSAAEKEFQVEVAERADEQKEVIDVLQEMIDNHDSIFQISGDLHDEVLRLLMETEPETAEKILNQISESEVDDTSSSVFEDSDNASLPRSPSSDDHYHMTYRDEGQSLRHIQSSEPCSVTPQELLVPGRHRRADAGDSSDSSASKPTRPVRSPRMPRVKISKDKNPESGSHSGGHLDSAHSKTETNIIERLLVPNLTGRRKSAGSIEPYLRSSSSSPILCDNSPQFYVPSPKVSAAPTEPSDPVSPSRPSSQQRPLGIRRTVRQSSTESSSDWRRERWKRREYPEDCYEQETLV